MCAGAVVLARVPLLVFGATDPKAGAVGSLMDLPRDERLNHRASVVGGIRADECAGVLTQFFHRRRAAATTRT
jgi:tRNA(adenine34) deaminase